MSSSPSAVVTGEMASDAAAASATPARPRAADAAASGVGQSPSRRGSQVSDVTAFVARSTEATEPEAYERWPEQPADEGRLTGTFESFGLPGRLT